MTSKKNAKYCALLLALQLFACTEYYDIEAPVDRRVFYPNGHTVSFQNTTTDEVSTFQLTDCDCHALPTYEYENSSGEFNRYHPEVCGQLAMGSNAPGSWLNHTVSAETGPDLYHWSINFENSFFKIHSFYHPNSNDPHYFDSLYVEGNWYYSVFVQPADTALNHLPRVDTVYFSLQTGVIKFVDSNYQSWVRQ